MLTLYHMPQAICAQKVRVALAEKGLDWESKLLTAPDLRSSEYLSINPSGFVPAIVYQGEAIVESRILSEFVDSFAGTPLRPADGLGRTRVSRWMKIIDDSLHINIFLLSFLIKGRENFLKLDEAARRTRQPLDPIKRFLMQDVIDHGDASQLVAAAVARFASLMDAMEKALPQGGWLAGPDYSLADCDYAPYLQRLLDLGLDSLWADHPAVSRWFDRVRARPSFAAILDNWVPPEERAAMESDAAAGRALLERLAM